MKKIIAIGHTERGRLKKITIDGKSYTRSCVQRRDGTNPVTVIPLDILAECDARPGDIIAWRMEGERKATVIFIKPEEITSE